MFVHFTKSSCSFHHANWVLLVLNADNSGTLKISYLYILVYSWKQILKSPRFVPFGSNLAQLEAKSDIPGSHLSNTNSLTDSCEKSNNLIQFCAITASIIKSSFFSIFLFVFEVLNIENRNKLHLETFFYYYYFIFI